MFPFPLVCTLLLLLFPASSFQAGNEPRTLKELSAGDLSALISSPDPTKNLDVSNPDSHLSKILIPRAPDTQNNTFVRKYLASTLKGLNWHIEEDSFQENTPYGMKTFTNLIATKDPKAPRRVILSAHFDSKFFPNYPENQFVGATDSAMPCALLLDLAEALNPLLDARKARFDKGEEDEDDNEAIETTLQLVFFDGEEAFKDWTSTDSLYGSRHLAEKWATTYIAPNPSRRQNRPQTQISTIEHLILLDLLGAPNPLIRSYFLSTAWLFDALVSAERRLGQMGALDGTVPPPNAGEGTEWSTWQSFFVPRTGYEQYGGHIEDDHVPFLRRGVNILHVIANPFPQVWHHLGDDASALDMQTMKRWNLIFRVFTAEYLGLWSTSPPTHTTVGRSNSDL